MLDLSLYGLNVQGIDYFELKFTIRSRFNNFGEYYQTQMIFKASLVDHEYTRILTLCRPRYTLIDSEK